MALLGFPTRSSNPALPPLAILFGRTEAMHAAKKKIESAAQTDIPVLIQGESGTGKELCVQFLHASARNSDSPLIKVSCPAIPYALLETELFGYEKGAFTGAQTTKQGRVEQASGGTLFFDEVGSLDLGIQAKLLQVLQDGTYSRVGGHESRVVKARLVCVANRPLREQVAQGSFRLDLLYRINVITIDLPPLRKRREDLPDLVDYFLELYSNTFRSRAAPLSRGVLGQMARYHWPGNIRQLDNLIRSYVLIGSQEALMAEMMPEESDAAAAGLLPEIDISKPLSLKQLTREATQQLEHRVILKVLKANNWNRQKTAKWLNISYRSLLYKLNEVGDNLPNVSGPAPAKPALASPGPLDNATRIM